jgi:alpha-1,6-mannosyltransferase
MSAEAHSPLLHALIRWSLLVALAGASSVVWWVAFTRPMWLPTYYAVPKLDTPKLLGVTSSSMLGFTLAVGVECAFYLAAFWAVRPMRSTRATVAILLLAVSIALPLVLAYPGGAGDIYAYVAEADSILRFHANPFFVPVSAIPNHPLLPFLDYPNETTHYGPLWVAIGAVLRLVAGPSLLSGLLVFKIAAVGFLLAVGWLAYLTLRRAKPDIAVVAALLLAWNPLLIFELAENAHNDIAMMAFVALAIYFQSRDLRRLAISALLAACLVKYVAVVLLPLFLLVDLRQAGGGRRWMRDVVLDAIGYAAVVAALGVGLGLDGTVGILQKLTGWYTTSPSAALYYWLIQSMPPGDATNLLGNSSKTLFILLYLAVFVRLWRKPYALLDSSLLVVVALMLVATSWFQPWYVAWAIPLAALIATPVSWAVLIGMTAGGFLIHTIMGFAWRLEWNSGSLIAIHVAGTAGMWLPVAVLGAVVFTAFRHCRDAAPDRTSPAPSETSRGSIGQFPEA